MVPVHRLLFMMLLSYSISLKAQSPKDTLRNISQFEFVYPCWSPNGTELVFQSNLTGRTQLNKRNNLTKEITR